MSQPISGAELMSLIDQARVQLADQQARDKAEHRCLYGDCRQGFPTEQELEEHLTSVRDAAHYTLENP